MADRSVLTTSTFNDFRREVNGTARDMGDISDLLGASSYIASATDIVESITLLNAELPEITTDAFIFPGGSMIFEGATSDDFETTLSFTDPTADRTHTVPDGPDGNFVLDSSTDTSTNKTFTTPTITSGVINTSVSGTAFLDEDNMASDSASKAASQQSIKAYTTSSVASQTGVTYTNPVLAGNISGAAFKDEDNMSSDSATSIASQQSIKAYVDDSIDADMDLVFAADSGGSLNIVMDSESLSLTGGTGIDTSGSSNTVTFAIDSTVATLTGSQTLTNKTFTSPALNSFNFTGTNSGLGIGSGGIIFEGATDDSFETTLTVEDPTQDNIITLPNASGTIMTDTTHPRDTKGFLFGILMAMG